MVTVTDQNDNTPKFTTNNRTFYVKENQHQGQVSVPLRFQLQGSAVLSISVLHVLFGELLFIYF